MFQESASDSDIWLVKLKRNQTSFVYRLTMPPGVIDLHLKMNSYFDEKLHRLVIPTEKSVYNGEDEKDDYDCASDNSAFELVKDNQDV